MKLVVLLLCVVGLIGCSLCSPIHDQTATAYFNLLDVNGDGFASLNEISTFVMKTQLVDEPMLPYITTRVREGLHGQHGLTFDQFAQQYPSLIHDERFTNETCDEPQQIHLSVSPPNSIWVIWVTQSKCQQSSAWFGTSRTGPFTQVQAETFTYSAGITGWHKWLHKAQLSNIAPNTMVYYRVGQDGVSTSQSALLNVTSPPSPGSTKPVRFITYGDMGTVMPLGFEVTDALVNYTSKTGRADFFTHLGDLSYSSTGGPSWDEIWDVYLRQIQPLASFSPYMTTIGNHELYGSDTAYNSRFRMPGNETGGSGNFYWSMQWGQVQFISMCTEAYFIPYAEPSPQYTWLEQQLQQATANRHNIPWIIFLGHRPMYSSEKDYSTPLQAAIEPLLVKYGVDIAMWGHEHSYERTFPMENFKPTQTPTQQPVVYRNPTTPTHLIIGTAGAMIAEKWQHPQPDWSADRHQKYGFGVVQVTNSTHLKFEFISRQLELVDSFSIVKDQPTRN